MQQSLWVFAGGGRYDVHVGGIFLGFKLFQSDMIVEHVLLHDKFWGFFLIDSTAFASLFLFLDGQSATTVLCDL